MCHCVRGHKRHITTWICFLHILLPHAISQDGLAKEEKNVLKMQRSWIYCNIKPKKLNLSCRHGTCRLKLKGWKMLQERRENATTSGKNRFVTGCALVQFQIGFLYRTLSLKNWKKRNEDFNIFSNCSVQLLTLKIHLKLQIFQNFSLHYVND